MSYHKNGGPAFPVPGLSVNPVTGEQIHHQTMESGASLRDYFAADALPVAKETVGPNPKGWLGVAEVAYEIADAMLAVREGAPAADPVRDELLTLLRRCLNHPELMKVGSTLRIAVINALNEHQEGQS